MNGLTFSIQADLSMVRICLAAKAYQLALKEKEKLARKHGVLEAEGQEVEEEQQMEEATKVESAIKMKLVYVLQVKIIEEAIMQKEEDVMVGVKVEDLKYLFQVWYI